MNLKISYGITVYNEHIELDDLLHHLSKHIRKEDEVVITQDISKVGDKSIVQDEFYKLEKIFEKDSVSFQAKSIIDSLIHDRLFQLQKNMISI